MVICLEPRHLDGFVGPEELESRLQRVFLVQVFPVADMVVDIRLELGLHVGEHLFRDDEVDLNVVLVPNGLLATHRTVGTASYQETLFLDHPNHIHGQNSRWITDVQRAVYVKTYQYHQLDSSF